jgi:hypothetical protein
MVVVMIMGDAIGKQLFEVGPEGSFGGCGFGALLEMERGGGSVVLVLRVDVIDHEEFLSSEDD